MFFICWHEWSFFFAFDDCNFRKHFFGPGLSMLAISRSGMTNTSATVRTTPVCATLKFHQLCRLRRWRHCLPFPCDGGVAILIGTSFFPSPMLLSPPLLMTLASLFSSPSFSSWAPLLSPVRVLPSLRLVLAFPHGAGTCNGNTWHSSRVRTTNKPVSQPLATPLVEITSRKLCPRPSQCSLPTR